MKLLVKFPTRERPARFFNTLDNYYAKLAQPDKVELIVSCDSDDKMMNTDQVKRRFKGYKNLTAYYDKSETKVDAMNRDVEKCGDWDILLLAQDDMTVVADGYDDIIREDMIKYYPDTDGALWYNVPPLERWSHICLLSILGRKYYDRFGYIYHPTYKSHTCDKEFTQVAQKFGKITFINRVIITQRYIKDKLRNRNNQHFERDVALYAEREKAGFPI